MHLAVVELDPKTGPHYVGVGGLPNAEGECVVLLSS